MTTFTTRSGLIVSFEISEQLLEPFSLTASEARRPEASESVKSAKVSVFASISGPRLTSGSATGLNLIGIGVRFRKAWLGKPLYLLD